MPHPRVLARAFLLAFVALTLAVLPTIYPPAEAAQPSDSATDGSPVSLVAATGVTPEYAVAHMARLQPAPQQIEAVLGDVVISEFRARLGAEGGDEFIELFNRSDHQAHIDGLEDRALSSLRCRDNLCSGWD